MWSRKDTEDIVHVIILFDGYRSHTTLVFVLKFKTDIFKIAFFFFLINEIDTSCSCFKPQMNSNKYLKIPNKLPHTQTHSKIISSKEDLVNNNPWKSQLRKPELIFTIHFTTLSSFLRIRDGIRQETFSKKCSFGSRRSLPRVCGHCDLKGRSSRIGVRCGCSNCSLKALNWDKLRKGGGFCDSLELCRDYTGWKRVWD